MTGAPDIAAAVRALHGGGVIGYPTEAVWGLGCDPFNQSAVQRLLAIKQRPLDKGLIMVAASVDQLNGLADWDALPTGRRDAVLASWPGPNTWIVPATGRVPRWITGDHDGVALRVSDHPVVAALCSAFGPITSTSANPAGKSPARTREELDDLLVLQLEALVGGETSGLTSPTPIRDARTGEVLRA